MKTELDKELSRDVRSAQFHLDRVKDINLKSPSVNISKTVSRQVAHHRNTVDEMVNKRLKELSIQSDHLDLLQRLTPDTYWVLNIDNKDQLDQIIKDRKVTISLYKRKLKAMNTRLAVLRSYARKF